MQGTVKYLSSSLTVTCCRIWTACLWYSSWACTSAESWLTCSICRSMGKSCLSYPETVLKQLPLPCTYNRAALDTQPGAW